MVGEVRWSKGRYDVTVNIAPTKFECSEEAHHVITQPANHFRLVRLHTFE